MSFVSSLSSISAEKYNYAWDLSHSSLHLGSHFPIITNMH